MSMPFARTSTAFVVRRNPSKILAVFPGECPQKAAVSLDFGRGLRYNFYGEKLSAAFFHSRLAQFGLGVLSIIRRWRRSMRRKRNTLQKQRARARFWLLPAAFCVRRFFKTKKPGKFPPAYFGAGNVTRTHDLLITNQLLYRLSYSSIFCFFCALSSQLYHYTSFCRIRQPLFAKKFLPPCKTRRFLLCYKGRKQIGMPLLAGKGGEPP